MLASIITVGDEILIGQIVDTNSAWLGTQLNFFGIQIKEIRSISDDFDVIQNTLRETLAHSDLILMTGGLGPTKDDVTKKALASFFNQEMEFHQETYDRMVKLFERFGRTPTEAHYQQAYHPKGATLLTNPKGTAPAMWFEENGKIIVSIPGVPYEMKALMKEHIFPRLQSFERSPIAHLTILTAGRGETEVAKRIESVEEALPDHMSLSYLPNLGVVRLRLTAKNKPEEQLALDIEKYRDQIQSLIPDLIFGEGKQTLEEAVGKILAEEGKTIGTAESCTGGYIASRIVKVPGASAYLQGSVVSYSNQMKIDLLDVHPETIETNGAVSEETAVEMAKGALDRLGVDVALSVSGIMGPGGGSPEKPVGTVWMAVADRTKVRTKRYSLSKDRALNIEYTGNAGLNEIRKFLLEIE